MSLYSIIVQPLFKEGIPFVTLQLADDAPGSKRWRIWQTAFINAPERIIPRPSGFSAVWNLYSNSVSCIPCIYVCNLYYANSEISLVEQYTTVDKYLMTGHFDPNIIVNCLTKTFGSKCSVIKHLSTVVYCLSSDILLSASTQHEPLQHHYNMPPLIMCSQCFLDSSLLSGSTQFYSIRLM